MQVSVARGRDRLRSLVAPAAVAAGLLAALAPGMAEAAFPGADGPIAFTSNRDVAAGELYATNPGGAATRLTSSNSSSDPAYSPDGTKIAFVAGGQIAIINHDGTGLTTITSTSTAKENPTWSPDGRIAYVANSFDVDGQTDREIWAINADGSGRVQLTNNTFDDREPAWSPDGTRIAFVASRPGDSNRNVYVMNANGTGEVNLTPDESLPCDGLCYQGHDDNPAWSPDGTRIAYVHTFAENASGLPNLWVMDANGANKDNVTDNDSVAFVQPAFSPQGTRLAAVGAVTTERDIWVMNADGSSQGAIDTTVANDIDPDWGVFAPAPPPPNDIAFGKVKRNEKKGTATLTVEVPGPGSLQLDGKNLKPQTKSAPAAGAVKLKVVAKGKAEKRLAEDGQAKVKPRVTFTPAGGAPNTESTKVKLVKD